jgi:hypothetical protein
LNKKINLAKTYVKSIGKNKNILFIGITGSVAAGNPMNDDDIDLLIITKKNKLWISRIQTKIILMREKIPHRRYGLKEKGNQLCLNLWLDESDLKLPKAKQNLKNAMDLILMKSIINQNKTYQKLIKTNNWAKKYVATGYSKLDDRSSMVDRRKKTRDIFDWIVNCFLFKFQYWYMRPKLRKEIINLKQAFFHPNG